VAIYRDYEILHRDNAPRVRVTGRKVIIGLLANDGKNYCDYTAIVFFFGPEKLQVNVANVFAAR